jgi:hypothetical protein
MNDNIDQHGNPIPGLDVDGNPTGNVGAGNVGAGNVGVGTSAPPPTPEPTPEPSPKPSGPIVSDDRDEAEYGSNPH